MASALVSSLAVSYTHLSVERTRTEAAKRRLNVQLFVADMLDLTQIPDRDFDAVMCMDNALPHLESDEQLFQAATQIRRKLRAGATFMGSIRDYDSLVQERPVVQEPAFFSDRGSRRIVHQVWDWSDERRYAFHLYITCLLYTSSRAGRSIWAGSWGAIQGANSAHTRKMTTNTTPVAAKGLWRAARGSEMVAVDNVKSYGRSAARMTAYSWFPVGSFIICCHYLLPLFTAESSG